MADFPGGELAAINPILNVADLAAGIAFYTEVLGLELHHSFGDPADFAIVGRDGQQIYLCQNGQGRPGTWLALFVTDRTALLQQLASHGHEAVPHGDEFRVQDPDGHVLRLFE
ncbi:VOC family protein [Paractinoplanes rishiriensis]|uniref:VOC domain-containing protein n=1 Tax=Paractinoplanes rishiriensis TaxID=1050105 RepID=A0A919MWS0_9ACTN|nr:VOC family protein [Actinoplanes rishiriensis]GIE98123.1 hypothetical protein Ari01nite_55880 [Actinoplanes rishiriensis]